MGSVLGTMGDINWALINSRLPYARTREQYDERRRMWRAIDVNDNGFVSLAEITRGVRDVINVPDLFDCRPAINRAFHHSKSVSKSQNKHADDYLDFKDFIEIWVGPIDDMEGEFAKIDRNGGGQILFS